MNPVLRHCRNTAAAVLFLSLNFFCGTARANTHIWQGPADGLWSVAGNWSGGVPATGEANGTIVQFGANTTSRCDIPGLVINQIHFTSTGNTINGSTALGIDGLTVKPDIQDDVGGNTLAASLPLVISGNICQFEVTAGTLTIAGNIIGMFGITKIGAGTLALNGNNSYGSNMVSDGTMLVNGSQPGSTVLVGNNAVFGGTGTVGATTISGASSLVPGVSGVGTLTTGDLTLGANSFLGFTLSTAAPGGFTSLNVNGTLALNGSSIFSLFSSTFNVAAGNSFVLIANDAADAISGEFKNLAEGAIFAAPNQIFTASYKGGTSNDFVLTAQTGPAVAAPSLATVGQTVNFSVGVNSSFALADALSFAWTFGDGGTGTGATVTHVYTIPGIYPAQVIITGGSQIPWLAP